MQRFVAMSLLVALLLSLGVMACVTLSHQKISPEDLPETPFEATLYRSGTGAPAVILDNPNDDVRLIVGIDKIGFKKQGLHTPQKYLKELGWRPEVHRLQHRETGNVWGYLLMSPELEWLVSYHKGGEEVSVLIEDPHERAP